MPKVLRQLFFACRFTYLGANSGRCSKFAFGDFGGTPRIRLWCGGSCLVGCRKNQNLGRVCKPIPGKQGGLPLTRNMRSFTRINTVIISNFMTDSIGE